MTELFLFSPAKAGRASEDVALQIEAAILNGQIMQGYRLPSEREMQLQFGTGRGVIREALRTLKQKGLIEIRKGKTGGAYVKQLDVVNVSETLSLFLKQKHICPMALIEFRESVDRTITVFAIARAGEKEKQELVDLTKEFTVMASSEDLDMPALGEMDRQLNIKLVEMAGNPIFEWIMHAVQLGFSSYDYHLYHDEEFRVSTAVNWQSTAREIAANEVSKALACISHHYFLLQRCLDKKDIQTKQMEEATQPSSLTQTKKGK